MLAIPFPAGLRPMAQASKVRTQQASYTIPDPRRAQAAPGPAGSDWPVVWRCQFVYTEAEAQTFLRWFFNDLSGGLLLASMPIRTEFGLITHDVRFVDDGLLTASHTGGVWTYSASVMAREQIVPA